LICDECAVLCFTVWFCPLFAASA